jgi:phage gpG-like protein
MSKFQFRSKAIRFRSKISAAVERMANNAVYEFKVVSFDSQSFDGRAWAPLKKPTGRQPLVKTGRMRDSITIISRTPVSAVVGSMVPYAGFQNAMRKFVGESRMLKVKNKIVLRELMRAKL